jgi:hypothetical protein
MRRAASFTLGRLILVTLAATVAFLTESGGSYGASSADTAQRVAVTEAALGTISPTENPLVARYSIAAKPSARVSVEFGTGTTYPFHTSTVSVPNTGQVDLLIAGMKAFTLYHICVRS